MLVKNVTLNGVGFSDADARANRVVLDSFKNDVQLATFTLGRQTSPGTVVGRSVAQGRLFTVKGRVFGTEAERQAGVDLVNSAVRPDDLISGTSLLELVWEDFAGRMFKTAVQVYAMPEWEHEKADSVASFSFDLISPDATFDGFEDKSRNVTISNVNGAVMPFVVPLVLGADPGAFSANNAGNYPAPIRLEIIGEIENPKVTNRNNGRFYGLSGVTTTQFVLDATVRPLSVTDDGDDVSGFREAGSVTPMLMPGDNLISITGIYSPSAPPLVRMYWNDTYIA
jgi:hypothetical protein